MNPFRIISVGFVLFVTLLLTGCDSERHLDFDAFVEKKLTDFLAEEKGQVISIAFVNSEGSYQQHFGQFPDGRKANDHTVYEIASITKSYVGLVLAKAVVDKKVDLDVDIRQYLNNGEYPNLHYRGMPITLRHLVNHTSGLPLEFAFDKDDINNGVAHELIVNYAHSDFFRDLKQVRITEKPGEDEHYSNVGTNLVGYILEAVYQRSLASLVKEFVTDKSGEMETQFLYTAEEIKQITQGTDGKGNTLPLLSPYSFADGGLTSTTASMVNYMQYLMNSEAEEIRLSRTFMSGSRSRYGHAYFWNTYGYDSKAPMFYHSGGSIGTSSWLAIYPESGLGIFISTNLVAYNTQGKLSDISSDIIEKYQDLSQAR